MAREFLPTATISRCVPSAKIYQKLQIFKQFRHITRACAIAPAPQLKDDRSLNTSRRSKLTIEKPSDAVQLSELLRAGYGVEDIAQIKGIPVTEVRMIVSILRERGELKSMISAAHIAKSKAATKA